MHLLHAGVCPVIEIDRQLNVVAKPVIAFDRLAILPAGDARREQQRAGKQEKNEFTTEDTEGF
jgi:hypothetical protein